MTSVRFLAKLAGVSYSTVSLALRDDPRVKKETKERIKALAERCQYRPNMAAHNALTGKRQVIVCIFRNLTSPFAIHILRGIYRAANRASFFVSNIETRHDMSLVRQAIRSAVDQRAAGIVISTGSKDAIPAEAIFEADSNNVPIVTFSSYAEIPVNCVRMDIQPVTEAVLFYPKFDMIRVSSRSSE